MAAETNFVVASLAVPHSQATLVPHRSRGGLLSSSACEWLLVFSLCLALANLVMSLAATKRF